MQQNKNLELCKSAVLDDLLWNTIPKALFFMFI